MIRSKTIACHPQYLFRNSVWMNGVEKYIQPKKQKLCSWCALEGNCEEWFTSHRNEAWTKWRWWWSNNLERYVSNILMWYKLCLELLQSSLLDCFIDFSTANEVTSQCDLTCIDRLETDKTESLKKQFEFNAILLQWLTMVD